MRLWDRYRMKSNGLMKIKPTDRDTFYHNPKWESLRDSVLRQDGYMCTRCHAKGKIIQAAHVHHIFPRETYPQYQYERWNLTSLCRICHNEMHNRYSGELSKAGRILLQTTALKQNIKVNMKQTILVIGLRGTGKTTYVKKHLDNDSIVYDMDTIASAFRLAKPDEEYYKPARKMANDFLYGFIAKAHDYVSTVYIIRTAPQIKELERIDPDKVIICRKEYQYKPMDDRASALERINEAENYLRLKGIEIVNA